MAIFYVLAPRERFEHEVNEFCRGLLPGVEVPPGLAEWLLEQVAGDRPGVYFVHREDLPGRDGVAEELVECFGAEAGDEIVEVLAGGVRRSVVAVGVSEPASDR